MLVLSSITKQGENMAYEKLQDLSTDRVFKLGGTDKDENPYPKQIEGYYLGSKTFQGTEGPSTIHVFQTPKGNDGIWGSKTLNDSLTSKVVGMMVLVVHKGKKKLSGKKTQHMYDISVDKENTIEVDASSAVEVTDNSSDTEFEAADNADDSTEDEDQAAALAQVERQAKVQAMLNKGKGKAAKA